MNDQTVIFLNLLETELERVVIPGSGTDMARNLATVAARQLRRELVERTIVPGLRVDAVKAYAALLPALREYLDPALYARLSRALTGAESVDWAGLDTILDEVGSALLTKGDAESAKLVGQLALIDVGVRAGKEKAWAERSQTKPAAVDATPPGGLNDNQKTRLLAFLKQRFPAETDLQIGAVKPLVGGFSKQTLFITLEHTVDLPDSLVMRWDTARETFGSSVTMEFPVIEKLYAHGIAVPRPFALDESGTVLGSPFMLVARVEGRTTGDFITVAEPSRGVALDLAEKLAKLHAVPIDGLEHVMLGGQVSPREHALDDLEKYQAQWRDVAHRRSYVVQAAIDWLKRNIHLADGRSAIVHRDVGVHNFLVKDDKVTAFLDWETSAIGSPLEDLAFAYFPIRQMIDWEEFLAAYERAAGVTVDRRSLDFYTLSGCVRGAVSVANMVDPVFAGTRESLSEYYLGDYIGEILTLRVAEKLAQILG